MNFQQHTDNQSSLIQQHPTNSKDGSSESWQSILRSNYTSLQELISYLEIPSESLGLLLNNPRFRINIPKRLVDKIEKGNLQDPIFLQFVPLQEEIRSYPGFSKEPVHDQDFRKEAKLLQKYEKRALIVATGACAMNCRFCFRQNYPYIESQAEKALPPEELFHSEISYIEKNLSLSEVILSGGDPLSLSDTQLRRLIEKIDSVPHIERIRIHTRFPIGIPERINTFFLSTLQSSSKQIVFVIHVNHPKEIDQDIVMKLKEIQKLGIPVLSQTVLLKGVNNSADTLCQLFSTLGKSGVIPYYLHQLDRVQGAHHFEVPVEEGKALIKEIQKRLSGYLVPSYVAEIPGEPGKTPLI